MSDHPTIPLGTFLVTVIVTVILIPVAFGIGVSIGKNDRTKQLSRFARTLPQTCRNELRPFVTIPESQVGERSPIRWAEGLTLLCATAGVTAGAGSTLRHAVRADVEP